MWWGGAGVAGARRSPCEPCNASGTAEYRAIQSGRRPEWSLLHPGFVSEEEARDLVARIDEMPEASWTDLKRRRLQNHGGTPHPDGTLSAPALAL